MPALNEIKKKESTKRLFISTDCYFFNKRLLR